jgi:hypothetical protein
LLDFGKRQRVHRTNAITRRPRPGRALRHVSNHADEVDGTIEFAHRRQRQPLVPDRIHAFVDHWNSWQQSVGDRLLERPDV